MTFYFHSDCYVTIVIIASITTIRQSRLGRTAFRRLREAEFYYYLYLAIDLATALSHYSVSFCFTIIDVQVRSAFHFSKKIHQSLPMVQ